MDAVAGTGVLGRRSKGGSGRSGTPWRGRAGAVAMSDTVAGASTHGCCGGGERARALVRDQAQSMYVAGVSCEV